MVLVVRTAELARDPAGRVHDCTPRRWSDLGCARLLVLRPRSAQPERAPGACTPALYGVCEWLGRALFGARAFFSYADVIPADGVARALVVLWFGLSAGVIEETLYRAYAWHLAAYCRRPRLIYLVLAPFLFALVHWEGGAASLAASWFYGLVAAIAYLALRNLWPLVVGHCTTDFLAFA